jgi:hypothetical protein
MTDLKDDTQKLMSDKLNRGVCNTLDIDDVDPIEVTVPEIKNDTDVPVNDAISDYEYIRSQSIKNIATCEAILTHALSTMTCDPSPRHIESCSTLIDTSMKCSKSLIEIHEKLQKLRVASNSDNSSKPDTVIEKFVGSVKDVLEQVKSEM